MSKALEEYRDSPGTKLMDGQKQKFMVIRLAAGMVEAGSTPSGGKTTVTVVSLHTGRCWYEQADTQVTEIE